MTAPTSGLGFVRPSPFFARAIARRIYSDSFETVSGIKKPRLNSGRTAQAKEYSRFFLPMRKLLPSRLYCRLRNRTVSCPAARWLVFSYTQPVGIYAPPRSFLKLVYAIILRFFLQYDENAGKIFSLLILHLRTDMNIVLSEFLCYSILYAKEYYAFYNRFISGECLSYSFDY